MFEPLFSAFAVMSRYERKSLFARSLEKGSQRRTASPSKRATRKAQKKARAITRKARKGGK